MTIGAAVGVAEQASLNWAQGKPLTDGLAEAGVIGGVSGALSMPGSGKALAGLAKRGLQQAGKLGKAAGKLGKGAAAVCRLAHSFAAETPVATPDGQRAIGSLQAGDQVTAYDPDTGQSSTQTVEQVWLNQDDDLLDVTLVASDATLVSADLPTKQHDAELAAHGSQAPPTAEASDTAASGQETIHTTQRHLWLTTDRGWVEAREMLGERVVRLDGSSATVAAVVVTPGEVTRYALTVSQVHTFAVGDGRLCRPQLRFAQAFSILNPKRVL